MITVYSKPNCPHCVQTKSYLDAHKIPYTVIDVLQDPDALAFIKGRGHKTVPQIYVGDDLLVDGGNSGLQAMSADDVRGRVAAIETRFS